MDGQKDDTHKASDGQAEGIAYDPFVLFGPGNRNKLKPQRICKHRGRWLNLCRCNTSVDGGIGRIFMTYDQATWCYVYNCMQDYPIVKLYANNREFIEGIKSGAVTCYGKQITYRG